MIEKALMDLLVSMDRHHMDKVICLLEDSLYGQLKKYKTNTKRMRDLEEIERILEIARDRV